MLIIAVAILTVFLSAITSMNEFLLLNKSAFAESKYGAYVFTDESSLSESTPDYLAYTALYNTTAKHGHAIFMNLLHSSLAREADGVSSISISNHPLPQTSREQRIATGLVSFFTAIGLVIAFSFIGAHHANFLVHDRLHTKHQQLVSGLSLLSYWLSSLAWDFTVFQLPAWGTLGILRLFNVKELIGPDAFLATLVLFQLYGLSSMGLTYLLSFVFKSASTAQNSVIFLNVIAMFIIMASFVMSQLSITCGPNQGLQYAFRYALRVIILLVCGDCYSSMREKDWRCCKHGTHVT